jgi:alpha-ketoglutarate-dependent taurine dioxygenase
MKESTLGPFGRLLELNGQTIASLPRDRVLSLLREHKLVLVRGLAPFGEAELLSFAADRAEDLVQWNFGPVMELKVMEQTENYLFSREAVPFHWDGAFHVEPRALVFQCLRAPDPAMGGETLFCDTEALLAAAAPEERAAWAGVNLTYETEKKAHYGGKFRGPMVRRHPDKGNAILRYAEPVGSRLNPVFLTAEGTDQRALESRMAELLYDPRFTYAHRWRDGDLLLADNFSLLHGRRAFADASPRHLRRVQIR